MAMNRKISGIRIGNQNKKHREIRQNQHLNPNEKYINKNSRIQEIHLEHIVSLDGWDIICRVASIGGSRQENCYRINLDNSNQTVLQEAPCKRKRSGLMMDRSKLKTKLAALLKQGIKGKGIAERLKISESMVKKLKDEMGLSKKRRPRTNYSSAESIASSLSDAKR